MSCYGQKLNYKLSYNSVWMTLTRILERVHFPPWKIYYANTRMVWVPWEKIHRGFQVGDEHIHFANRARGIFKPRQMTAALSIKTTIPRAGRPTWYSDQGLASSMLETTTGLWHYELARGGLNDPDPIRRCKWLCIVAHH